MLSLLFAVDEHSQETMTLAPEQQEGSHHRNHSSPDVNPSGTWDPAHHRAPAAQTEWLMVHCWVESCSETEHSSVTSVIPGVQRR